MTKKNRTIKKIISYILMTIMIFNLSANSVNRIFAAEDKVKEVDNGIIKYVIDSKGRFLIKTVKGNPLRDQDKNKWLLFQDEKQDTSFTTFRIDGEDYIFGERYAIDMSKKCSLVGTSQTIGKATLTKWKVGEILITQRLELVEDTENPNYGNVLVQYMVENNSDKKVNVGSRILFDTMIGTNDGAGVKVGSEFIDTETEFQGDAVPEIWRSTDNEFAPKVIGYGFTKGWGNKAPDKMIIGHWQGISETTWDYEINKDRNFTIESEYGKKDTAIALYWEPKDIEAGEVKYIETYYGIGEIPKKEYTYNVQLSSISKLTVNDSYDGYNEKEFIITAYIENNLPSSEEVYDVTATLDFEDGIELVEGDDKTKVKRLLKKNGQYAFTWKVKATPQNMYKMIKYRVDIYDRRNINEDSRVNREDIYSSSRFILVPSINGAPPEIHYNTVSPNKMYYSGKRSFTIKGTGFETYKDTSKWTFKLNNPTAKNKKIVTVPSNQIVILDDTSMLVTIEETLDSGNYSLMINEKTLPFQITILKDKKYLTRNYGLLAIVKDFSYDEYFDELNYFYRVLPLKGEEQLRKLKDYYKKVSDSDGIKAEKEVLLTIKGDVREVRNDKQQLSKYIVYSAHKKAVINDIMTYSSDIPLVISDNKQQILNVDPNFDFDYDFDLIPKFDLIPNFDLDIDMDLDMDVNLDLNLPNMGLNLPDVDLNLPNLSYDLDFEIPDMSIDIDLPNVPGINVPNFDLGVNLDLIKDTYVYIQGAGLLGINTSNGFDFWLDQFSIALKDGQNYTLKGDRENAPDELVVVNLEGIGAFLNVMLSGLPVKIHEVVIANRRDKDLLSFGAKVMIPFAGGDGKIGIDAKDVLFSKKGYEGLKAEGSIGMPNYGAVKGGSATVYLDTFDQIYGMNGQAEIGNLNVDVRFEIVKERENDTWYLNKLILAGGGKPGIPVVAGSVYITKLGGGVENLAQLTNPYYGGAEIFTVVVLTDISVVPKFEGEFEGRFNKRKMRIDGDLHLKNLPIFDTAYLESSWDTDGEEDYYVLCGGSIDIANGLVDGKGSIYISDTEYKGKGKVSFKVPKSVPIVGGMTLARAAAGINKDKIWGAGELSVLIKKVRITGSYGWKKKDLDVKFASKNNDHIPIYATMSDGIYEMDVKDGNKDGKLVYGTNMKIIESSKDNYKLVQSDYVLANLGCDIPILDMESTLTKSEDNKVHTIHLNNKNDYLLEIEYEGNLPKLKVNRPDGTEVKLSEGANYYTREGIDENGHNKNYIVIGLTEKTEGDWKVISDTSIKVKLAEIEPIPELTTVDAKLNNQENKIIIDWTGENYKTSSKTYTSPEGETIEVDTSSKIEVYLSDDRESVGRLLVKDYDPIDGTTTIDIPDGVQTGDYYINVALSTEDISYSNLYSEKIHITNNKAPKAVKAVQGTSNGNGYLKTLWELPQDDKGNTTGYYIEVFNSENKMIEDFGSAYIEGTKCEAIIGGKYKGIESDKILGLETGKTYRIGVTPVHEEDGKKYYGQIAYSDDVFLPNPNPPQLDVKLDGKNRTKRFINGEGLEVIGTRDRDVTINVGANEIIDAEIYVDSNKYTELSGENIDIQLFQLTDGEHIIDIVAKNKMKDITVKRFKFTVDTKPPILMIDSPVSNGIVENDIAIVKGTTNAGAKIIVNGKKVSVDENGKFNTSIKIRNSYKDFITISSEDNVGNNTTAEIQVINGNLKPINKVSLSPNLEEMEVGDSVELKLIGIQKENGEKMFVDSENVKWTIMEGNTIASINDKGQLTVNEEGDVVVLASYKITEEYSFQDALVIEVIPKKEEKPQPPHNNTPGTEGDKDKEEIEEKLEEILESIIKKNKDIKVIKTFIITPDEPLFIKDVEELTVSIEKGTVDELDKVLIGKVTNLENYFLVVEEPNDQEDEETSIKQVQEKNIVSNIYELEIIKSQRNINKPIEVQFNYDKKKVHNPKNLTIYRYNNYMKKWEYVGGEIDELDSKVTVKLNHFSKYALFEENKISKFSDLKEERWSSSMIYALKSLGVVDGIQKANGTYYEPMRPVTRGEFMKLLSVTQKLDLESGNLSNVFADWAKTPEWVKPFIYTCYKNDLSNGQMTSSGLLVNSNELITRAEAFTLIGRAFSKLEELKIKKEVSDDNKIPNYAKKYIYRLIEEGILNGYPDGTIKPMKEISREEAAKLIYNLIDYYNE